MSLKSYAVDISGLQHTLQLSDEDAARLGDRAVLIKPAAKRSGKAATPTNKAAPKPANKASKTAAAKADPAAAGDDKKAADPTGDAADADSDW